MGEAKRKAAVLAAWKDSLSPDEQIVLDIAEAAYRNIVQAFGATGMCYRMSFFLAAYLLQEHDLRIEPVVGFVNDGTGDVMTSHAWIELNGKKTDLTLTRTDHPDAQPPGPLLILDREFSKGRAAYTYHREQSPESLRVLEALRADLDYAEIVRLKEVEHQQMTEISRSHESMREFLDGAPDGMDYEAWAVRIRGVPMSRGQV